MAVDDITAISTWNNANGWSVDNPMPAVESEEEAEERERDWVDLETTAREFIASYGAAAMLRCVSRALESQQDMFKK